MIDCVMYVIIVRIMNGYYVNEWLRDDEKFGCCIFILYFEIYIYIYFRRGLDGYGYIWIIKIFLGRRVLYNCIGNIKLNGKFVDFFDFLILKLVVIVLNVCLL